MPNQSYELLDRMVAKDVVTHSACKAFHNLPQDNRAQIKCIMNREWITSEMRATMLGMDMLIEAETGLHNFFNMHDREPITINHSGVKFCMRTHTGYPMKYHTGDGQWKPLPVGWHDVAELLTSPRHASLVADLVRFHFTAKHGQRLTYITVLPAAMILKGDAPATVDEYYYPKHERQIQYRSNLHMC